MAVMPLDEHMARTLGDLLTSWAGKQVELLGASRAPLKGGLDGCAVERIVANYRDEKGRDRVFAVIAKQLDGSHVREAEVYRSFVAHVPFAIAPALLGIEDGGAGRVLLYLEEVRRVRSWPWRELPNAGAVIDRLARLHELARGSALTIPQWDYEDELHGSAVRTLELLQQLRSHPEFSSTVRFALQPVGRFISALPARRHDLLQFASLGDGLIHGDVHPGNALVRRSGGQAVLIDWARARTGSPLEDVSSWLQSLGYWEPEVRRKHDTLLCRYMAERGHAHRLYTDLRAAYWVAAACNALAGALAYHCLVITTASANSQRAAAMRSARDWLRVILRADALST